MGEAGGMRDEGLPQAEGRQHYDSGVLNSGERQLKPCGKRDPQDGKNRDDQ